MKKLKKKRGLGLHAAKPGSLTELAKKFEEVTLRDEKRKYSFLLANPAGKKTVLVAHGVTGSKYDMAALMTALAEKGYKVYSLDLPSHGQSDREQFGDFDELGQWMADALKVLNEPVDILLTNSFASGIGYSMMSQGLLPEGVRVILGCPTPRIASKAYLLNYFGRLLSEELSNAGYNSELGIKVRVDSLCRKKIPQQIGWMYESEYFKVDWISGKATTHMTELFLKSKPYKNGLPEDLQRRITIVAGTKDNAVTRDALKYLQRRLPKAKYVKALGAGHLLHFEGIDEMVAAVIAVE